MQTKLNPPPAAAPRKQSLSPAETRGCLTIASIRPDYVAVISRDYGDLLSDKRIMGMVSSVLRALDLAIEQGAPEYFVKDLNRDAARNWGPRRGR